MLRTEKPCPRNLYRQKFQIRFAARGEQKNTMMVPCMVISEGTAQVMMPPARWWPQFLERETRASDTPCGSASAPTASSPATGEQRQEVVLYADDFVIQTENISADETGRRLMGRVG
jgi:hypothetical protein